MRIIYYHNNYNNKSRNNTNNKILFNNKITNLHYSNNKSNIIIKIHLMIQNRKENKEKKSKNYKTNNQKI